MSKALEIAKYLVNTNLPVTYTKCLDAAAELRRLHDINAELVAALKELAGWFDLDTKEPAYKYLKNANKALAKAKEQSCA